ncbi:MAG: hypothetical protein AMXMBFR33_58900 [Candidatus Xenobia bacterium]
MGRWLLLVCLTCAALAQENWLELRVEPGDARVLLQRPGYAAEPLGRAGQRLPAPAAGPVILRFERPGWKSLEVRLDSPSGLYPPTGQPPLRLEPDPAGGWHRLGRRVAPAGLALLGLAALALLARRARGQHQRKRLRQLVEGLDRSDPLTGTALGAFRLLEPLGRGTSGTVYRALPEDSLDPTRAVAVKVLHREFASSPVYRRRFERETRITGELEHANLVRVLASGSERGLAYLATELVEGRSLRQVLEQGRPDPADSLAWIAQALEGVACAHDRGVVHRDLKPENLLLTDQGVLKVVDFGVAAGESYTVLTATGFVAGTPTYLAPEQIAGEAVPASDQYSLGVVLYELLNGAPPFQHPDPMALAQLHVGRPPPPLPPETPGATAVMRMLKKAPGTRFPDCRAAAAALRGEG